MTLALLGVSCANGNSGPTAGRTPNANPTPSASPTWAGYPEQEGGVGEISVTEFNDFIESTKPSWITDPLRAALEFIHGGPPSQEALPFTTTVIQKANGEESTEARVTVVQEGLLDDATAAIRYRLEFAREDGGTWRLVSAFEDQRCGPQTESFTVEPCV